MRLGAALKLLKNSPLTFISTAFGMIRPGEPIVLVIAASAHRADAFHAAEFVMDFLKTDAPFWKKEHRENAASSWVEAHAADDEAKARWQSR